MNTLLKISLLLCLTVSSTAYASYNTLVVDMEQDNNLKRPRTECAEDKAEQPSQKRQKLSNTNTPATSAPIKSLKRPQTEIPLIEDIVADVDETMGDLSMVVAATPRKMSEEAEESKNAQSNSDVIGAMQLVWANSDLVRLIGSFIPGHLHSFCLTSQFNHLALSSKVYLEDLMSPYTPSTHQDFGMGPFQFLNFYSKGSFTRLDNYASESTMYGMRISDNGAFVYFDNDDFQSTLHTKWNVATKQAITLNAVDNIIAMTGDGKTLVGNTCCFKDGGYIFQAACWHDDHADATLLPLKKSVDISRDGQSILGYSLKTPEKESEPVLYANGKITPLLPLKGITYFTPHRFLQDGTTILGWDSLTPEGKEQAVVLRNGVAEKLPKEFKWTREKSKSNQLIGWYNNELSEYTAEEVKPLSLPLTHITSFNDGPVTWGLKGQLFQGCWIYDRAYSLNDLIDGLGIKLGEEEKLCIMDTTKNNRTIVGVIENYRTSVNTPFIANLPPQWFNK